MKTKKQEEETTPLEKLLITLGIIFSVIGVIWFINWGLDKLFFSEDSEPEPDYVYQSTFDDWKNDVENSSLKIKMLEKYLNLEIVSELNKCGYPEDKYQKIK